MSALRPLVNYINRRPIDEHATEAIYTIHVVCDHEAVSDPRDLLFAQLEVANYPIREIDTLSENDDQVELAAILVQTSAEPVELNSVVAALKRWPVIKSATWTVGMTASVAEYHQIGSLASARSTSAYEAPVPVKPLLSTVRSETPPARPERPGAKLWVPSAVRSGDFVIGRLMPAQVASGQFAVLPRQSLRPSAPPADGRSDP